MVFINQLLIDFPIQTSYLQSPFSIGRDHIPTTGTAVETMCMFFLVGPPPAKKKNNYIFNMFIRTIWIPKSMGLSFKNLWETMVFTCFTINLSGFNIIQIMCQNLWFSPSWWGMDIQKDKLETICESENQGVNVLDHNCLQHYNHIPVINSRWLPNYSLFFVTEICLEIKACCWNQASKWSQCHWARFQPTTVAWLFRFLGPRGSWICEA